MKNRRLGFSVSICVRGSQGSPQRPGHIRAAKDAWEFDEPPRSNSGFTPILFLKAIFRFALIAVLAVFGFGAPGFTHSRPVPLQSGQQAESREDFDTAFDRFQKANAKDPKDLTYRTSLFRVRVTASTMHVSKGRKLLQAGDEQGALGEFLHAAEIDPGNEAAQQEIARVRQKNGQAAPASEGASPEPAGRQQQIDSISAPAELKNVSNEPLTLHMTEDAKVVYQAIGKAAGINVLFDPDYNSKRIQVDLNNVSLMDGLRIVGTMSGTFWRPVTANTIFVAQNTRIKRTELDEQAVQTFYLTNAWQQNDLNDVQTALRNVLTSAKIYGVASQNAIVMRGTPDELLLAQKLINDLDKARSEVVVDIAVLEVSKNWERTLGIAWPSSVGVALQPPTPPRHSTTSSSTTSQPARTTTSPTLYDLAHLKATDFAVTVGSATANLLLTDSNTKILQNPAHPRHRRAKSDHEDRRADPDRHRFLPDRRGHGGGQLAGQYPVPVPGRGREHRDDAHRSLRPRRHAEDQDRSHLAERLGHHQRRHRADHQPESRRPGHPPARGRSQHPGRHPGQPGTGSWTGIPGLSSIPDPQIPLRLQGSHHHTTMNLSSWWCRTLFVSQQLDQANLRTIDTGAGQSIDLRHDARSSEPLPYPRLHLKSVPLPIRTRALAWFPDKVLRPPRRR